MSSSARSPYVLHPQSEGHPVETNEATVRPSAPETFEERNTRTEAAMIMASNERLEWHARARNESVPQTRLHFAKIVAGIRHSQSPVKWEDDYGDSEDEDPKGKRAEGSRRGARTESGESSSGPKSGPREGGRSGGHAGGSLKAKHKA